MCVRYYISVESREVLKGLSVARWVYALNDRDKKRGSKKRDVDVLGRIDRRARITPAVVRYIFPRWILLLAQSVMP